VNVLVAVPPCDPHTSKVSSPSADRHSGRRRRPLRFERSRCAGPGGDPPEPPAVPARGATPRSPPHALRAPWWYFADTPATRPGQGPGSLGR
jgi:hypothetical protein